MTAFHNPRNLALLATMILATFAVGAFVQGMRGEWIFAVGFAWALLVVELGKLWETEG